jgi:Beta-ketoacyl synthase, N-terminal domain
MSSETFPDSKAADTPIFGASFDSIRNLAADAQSALSHLKTQMDVEFDAITALLEKRPLLPAATDPELAKPSQPEMPENLSSSQRLLIEKQHNTSPAAATFLLKVPDGEFTEKFDLCDKSMPIAIVGMGCRFPQDATSPEKLWNMIMRKQSALSDVPSDRFNIDAFYHPDSDRNGMVSKTEVPDR